MTKLINFTTLCRYVYQGNSTKPVEKSYRAEWDQKIY